KPVILLLFFLGLFKWLPLIAINIKLVITFNWRTAEHIHILNKAVTKILYPEIARRYGTTALRVERCIRSAIETAWDRASPETLPKYFGCTVSSQRGKPSNAEFIALLAERLTLEDDQALRA
ncbi:sporulation initiation factor Spo0A C-terminal domain-containing protein, partial [Dysosmobacter sp.]|uniref:sporulation initiation factor Spo0A C-terminal domain-containing protein n=1 Tax=Dysosmobacter sp. TaxID=2591382 RepID=UPI003AF61F85